MKFLKKIKLNYNYKLFHNYISNKDFNSAYQLILDLSKEDQSDFFIFLRNIQNQLSNFSTELVKNKIIWIISYDSNDTLYLNEFINYYLSRNSNISFHIDNFVSALNKNLSELNLDDKTNEIKFNDFKLNSNFYQNLVLFSLRKDFLFLNSRAAFFETNNKSYFIYPNTTFCYFYISRSPESLFSKYKDVYGSAEGAYDELFNFNKKEILTSAHEGQRYQIYENRTNINTHFESWTDPNVISTYRGKILDYNKLFNEKEDILLEVLYHLKQFGLDMEINIKDIKNFLETQNFNLPMQNSLSQNEKKFLNKNINTDFRI
ncbi:hypothetical protein OA857_01515 [Alphaproteobacteria bacterium]|nr:hypothetical protein [Alphaproteobacteria bacterium]